MIFGLVVEALVEGKKIISVWNKFDETEKR